MVCMIGVRQGLYGVVRPVPPGGAENFQGMIALCVCGASSGSHRPRRYMVIIRTVPIHTPGSKEDDLHPVAKGRSNGRLHSPR